MASTAPKYAPPAQRPGARQRPRPVPPPADLHVVPGNAKPQRRNAFWAVAAAAVLVLGAVVFPLLLNTQMAQMAYEVRDAEVEIAELDAQRTVLEAQLLEVSSPQELDARARALGLVPAAAPGAVSLVDGTVIAGEEAR